MESSLRRQNTLPMEPPAESPPRKILKAKRRLTGRSSTTVSITSSLSGASSIIKPSLSKIRTTSKKGSMSSSLEKVPSLSKKVSISKDTDDIATAAVSLDSGSHIGKTGVISEDDVGPDAEITEVGGASAFSDTGEAVVSSLRKSVSGTGSLTKKLSKKKSSVVAPPVSFLPPGGLIEIAFSFDTTGSMSAALNEVKGRIKDIVQKLQSDVPGIRIAIFAHGDYCDKHNYIIKWIDFGASLPEIHDFVNNCGPTGGGDGPECYELVLRRASEVLSWTPGSKRSLVVIGDDIPHEPGYKYGDFTNDINWRDECTKLAEMNVKVYGVACRASVYAKGFYQDIAKRTGGLMITLDKFDLIFDMMMSICYREGGDELLEAYQEELKEKYGVDKLSKNLSGMFSGLGSGGAGTSSLFGAHAAPTLFGTPRPAPTGGLFGKFGGFGKGKPIMAKKPKVGKAKTTKAGKAKGRKIGKKALKAPKLGKRAVTASKTVEKKKKSKTEPEIRREKMKESVFKKTKPLNNLKWSPWKQVMSYCEFPGKKGRKIKSVDGYLAKEVFPRDFDSPGVFEFAVNPYSCKRKYVVFFNITRGLPSPGKWFQHLIGRKYLKEKFRQAMSQMATVFVRRGKFKTRNKKTMEKAAKVLEKNNYAFGTSKRNMRGLTVKGLSI